MQLLDCMMHPRLLIEYMSQLVGEDAVEVTGVVKCYLSVLSLDPALMVLREMCVVV